MSAWISMLRRVSCWPLPGTSLRKPAWLTGVGPDTPLAGEGGVIWDTNRAFLLEAAAGAMPVGLLLPLKMGGLAAAGMPPARIDTSASFDHPDCTLLQLVFHYHCDVKLLD